MLCDRIENEESENEDKQGRKREHGGNDGLILKNE